MLLGLWWFICNTERDAGWTGIFDFGDNAFYINDIHNIYTLFHIFDSIYMDRYWISVFNNVFREIASMCEEDLWKQMRTDYGCRFKGIVSVDGTDDVYYFCIISGDINE